MRRKGQTAIEYLLLIAIVVGIVLVSLPRYIPRIYNASNVYFDKASNALLGERPRCGDGVCSPPWEDNERCCADCDIAGIFCS